jgi:hypothetical protein
MTYKAVRFISESIEVIFDKSPLVEKKPGPPDGFIWRNESYRLSEVLNQWQDFERRGSMAHNMRPSSMKKALRRGSYGVGRFYFRVRTESEQIFELYYDRVVKNVNERKGEWILFREIMSAE